VFVLIYIKVCNGSSYKWSIGTYCWWYL